MYIYTYIHHTFHERRNIGTLEDQKWVLLKIGAKPTAAALIGEWCRTLRS